MVWYNPLDWFKRDASNSDHSALYCDNPQCGLPLQESPVAYDRDHHEIYHDFSCAGFAVAHRTLAQGGITQAHAKIISLDQALRLYHSDQLKQKPSLEARTE